MAFVKLAPLVQYKQRGYEAYALRLSGDIASRRDPPEIEQAEEHYRQALALAEELGMRPLAAHCHFGLGDLYRRAGRPAPARAELSTAVEMYRDMEMTFYLGRAETALIESRPHPRPLSHPSTPLRTGRERGGPWCGASSWETENRSRI